MCFVRPARGAFVLAALLVPAERAAAGPLAWEYAAELARVGPASGPASSLLGDEFISGGSTIHEQTYARLSAAPGGAGWGWQSVRVGALTPDGPSFDPMTYAAPTFAVRLTLTDLASGLTGTVAFTGRGWEELGRSYDFPFEVVSRRAGAELTGPTEQALTLAGTEYRVGLRAVARDGVVDFYADVRAGAVHATPEPGTLALAGLGAAALAVRRRRA